MSAAIPPLTPMSPMTPADCDLRDFAFIPLDVVRLRDSDMTALVSGDEFRSAVLLWCASWHQTPAASLPDDDRVLSNLAGFGFAVDAWRAVREGALHGWVKCADGRLYHPVVAEKAREAWRGKLKQRWETEKARVKKHNQRNGTTVVVPEFDEWSSSGRPSTVLGDARQMSPRTGTGCPGDVPPQSVSKGQQQGHRQGQGHPSSSASDECSNDLMPDGCVPVNAAQWASFFGDEHGIDIEPTSVQERRRFVPLAIAWCNANVSIGRMRQAIAEAQAKATEAIVFLPAYVDRVLANQGAPRASPRSAETAAILAGLAGDPFGYDHEHDPGTIEADARFVG